MELLLQVAEIFTTRSPLYGELRESSFKDRKLKIVAYPNPVTSQLYIESSESISSIRCFDAKGKLIHHIKPGDRNYNYLFSTQSWKEGLYIVEIVLDDNDKVHRKVIKTRQ